MYIIHVFSPEYGEVNLRARGIENTHISDKNLIADPDTDAIKILIGRAFQMLDAYTHLRCVITIGTRIVHETNIFQQGYTHQETGVATVCKDCSGTGKVTLLTSTRDCNCQKGKCNG